MRSVRAWSRRRLTGRPPSRGLLRDARPLPGRDAGCRLIVIFPLAFLGGAFVPILGMAAVRRRSANGIRSARWVATSRKLADGYSAHGSWLMSHAELSMVIWSLLLLAIFVPLALHRFNNTVSA